MTLPTSQHPTELTLPGGPSVRLPSAVLTGGTVWLLVRVALALFTALWWMSVLPLTGKQLVPGTLSRLATLLHAWTNWDGGWYLSIAQSGYTRPTASAFFPLFPILVRAVGTQLQAVVDPNFPILSPYVWTASSLLVANACGLLALISIVCLVRQEGGDHAEVAAALGGLVAFPLAFFMVAGYTESLMLALTALTLLFARRRNWWAAAVTAYLGALTHDLGILLALPILWEFAASHGWWKALWQREIVRIPGPRELVAGALAVVAAPLGTATFFAYLWSRFGTPLARLHASGNWGRHPVAPWTTALAVAHALTGSQGTHNRGETALDAGLFLLSVAVLILAARRIPASFTLYGFLSLAVIGVVITPSGADPIEASGRLLLGVLPVFLGFARLTRRRPGLQVGCLVAGTLLQGLALSVWMAGGLIE